MLPRLPPPPLHVLPPLPPLPRHSHHSYTTPTTPTPFPPLSPLPPVPRQSHASPTTPTTSITDDAPPHRGALGHTALKALLLPTAGQRSESISCGHLPPHLPPPRHLSHALGTRQYHRCHFLPASSLRTAHCVRSVLHHIPALPSAGMSAAAVSHTPNQHGLPSTAPSRSGRGSSRGSSLRSSDRHGVGHAAAPPQSR